MKTEIRNKLINNEKFLNLNEILKEKIIYENICYKHNLSFNKYCSYCNKDICQKCEIENHSEHDGKINYENLLPDINEMNLILKNVKQYENDNNILFNEINNWKNEFNNILNEYKSKVNDIIDYIKNFNQEKINYNLIYKYRLIFDILSEYEPCYSNKALNEKNKKIIEKMEKTSKGKINIKNDCQKISKSINKLKEFIKYLNIKNSFINTITKIIDIINIKSDLNNISNKYINKKPPDKIKEISPLYINKIQTHSSSDNIKTSASSFNKNKFINKEIYNKKFYNNTIESISETNNNERYKTSKSMSNINSYEKNNCLNNFGIYEKKTVRQNSTNCVNNIKKINLNLFNNDLDINNNKDNKNNNNAIKLDKNTLQNSINATKIFLFKNLKEDRNKVKFNKTQNFINKTFFNKNNKFINNIKISKPEDFNIISYSSKEPKNFSKSFKYNNSLDNITKFQELNELSKIHKNKGDNNIFLINSKDINNKNISLFNLKENNYRRNNNKILIEQYRPKKYNSVENTEKRSNINDNIKNNIDVGYNQGYNKKENNLYVHKRFITLDMSKSLSSFESNTSSIISSSSSNNNIFLNYDPFFNNRAMIKNITNYNDNQRKIKLYIGLELGNTECKIGINQENNYKLKDTTLRYLTFPSIISFIQDKNNPNKLSIKIGEESDKIRLEKVDSTVFNIIKLFGQNINDIFGKKELWPFNIYNDSNKKNNKPLIKIKHLKKDIYYTIEDILFMYLKQVFEIFFSKLIINNTNSSNYIKINITIGVPNYFNYTQRKLLKYIFTTNLFPKKRYNKYNIYSKFNIELNNIYIEHFSNLTSYSIFRNKNNQKFSIYNLILSIEGCSTNISLVKLSKDNKNKFIEIKYINSAEFGEEDFLDNLIYSCLSNLKEKVKNNCMNSPLILAKIRKALTETKNKFDKEEIKQIEIVINRLFGNIDLKMNISIDNYYSACIGLFRKIVFLIKETIINSRINIEQINDIILIGNISQNIKLKKMISELFKERNQYIYIKLINKSDEIDEKSKYDNSIIEGAIIHCFNKSRTFPEYKINNISPSSFGIENYTDQMDFLIKKGENIPIRLNKFIKIKKPINNIININIFEGENKYSKNNKLISNNSVDINNLINFKKDEKYVEILVQFFMDSNYNIKMYILDKNTYKKQYECIV